MLERIFPRQLDNDYRGWRAGLWVFGVVVALKLVQSLAIIFNGRQTVRDADGIAIDGYPAEAAQNVVAMFGQSSLWRLLMCLLGVLVLVRYRTAVPLMFFIFLLSWVLAQVYSIWMPLIKTGTPPGPYVNLLATGLMLVGLVMSVMRRKGE